MKIQYLLSILIFTLGCHQKTGENFRLLETEKYISHVDSIIEKQSPYQYVNAFKRFGTYMFEMDTNLNLNPEYPYIMLTGNYDTLTRKLTSIGIFYFRDKNSTYHLSDEINFDESQRVIKIRVLNDEQSMQHQAYYYFRKDSLVQKIIHDIEIADLGAYLTKIDSIKNLVTERLIKEGHIDN